MTTPDPAAGTEGNVHAIRDAVSAAQALPPADPDARAGEDVPDRWGRPGADEPPRLPADCPVKALGKNGQKSYFLDELGQMIEIGDPQKLGNKTILGLFGRKSQLCYDYWPRLSKPDKNGKQHVSGWMVDVASQLLLAACAQAGVFDPIGKVRGRGGHVNDEGQLVLHCGDKILVGQRWEEPGMIGRFVYPTQAAIPRPALASVEGQDAVCGERALDILKSWNWARPQLDPLLSLGWIGCAMAGGAADFRSMVWLTGDRATGKSTLQLFIESVFDGAILQASDSSEAAIRQLLGQQTLPVALDEQEPEPDTRKMDALVKLARQAASGGRIFRGGQNHEGHEFIARSCFLFSSILLPPLAPQDRSRMAILELNPLGATAKMKPDKAAWRALGRQLRLRLVLQWHRYAATLERYQSWLAEFGHNGRMQDQFGNLLAFADMMLHDQIPDDRACAATCEMLDARWLAEKQGDEADHDRCVRHIATSTVPGRGGDDTDTVAALIVQMLDRDEPGKAAGARKRLGTIGLRVVSADQRDGAKQWKVGDPEPGVPVYLAVASSGRGLSALFRDTHWQDKSGALGVWNQSLGRVEGAVRGQKVRIDAQAQQATLVPMLHVIEQPPQGGDWVLAGPVSATQGDGGAA